MAKAILGLRIRERRRHIGVTQADLARQLGISASYLNLIEHNKRQIGGALLRRTAQALRLTLEELDGARERRLVADLEEIAHLPDLGGLAIEEDKAGELLGRYPGWARALVALARAERDSARRAEALSDRLTHDPFLGETVHRMLSRITAIRSVSEILVDFEDVGPEERSRFNRIVREESRNLSAVAEALAAYFDRIDDDRRRLTPVDEVEALFVDRDNRFEEIETAAEDLAEVLEAGNPTATAEQVVGPIVDALIGRQPQIETVVARGRARRALMAVAEDALRMPMSRFAPRARALRYDVEALATDFRVGFPAVCHRLTALPRSDDVPRFGCFETNAAGTITAMLGLPGLSVPRYASACPLWILYRAQQQPNTVMRQLALFPNGGLYVFLARARRTGERGFGRPLHYVTDMLTLTAADASMTVYAPAVDTPAEQVGPACRLCPRERCRHRVEDPLGG